MELKFDNIKEFAEHKKVNKAIYGCMSYKEKKELKNKVYSLKEKTNKKDLIWEYLNEPMDSVDFIRVSLILNTYRRGNDKNNNRL